MPPKGRGPSTPGRPASGSSKSPAGKPTTRVVGKGPAPGKKAREAEAEGDGAALTAQDKKDIEEIHSVMDDIQRRRDEIVARLATPSTARSNKGSIDVDKLMHSIGCSPDQVGSARPAAPAATRRAQSGELPVADLRGALDEATVVAPPANSERQFTDEELLELVESVRGEVSPSDESDDDEELDPADDHLRLLGKKCGLTPAETTLLVKKFKAMCLAGL